MIRSVRGLIIAGAFGLLAMIAGCTQSNEQDALRGMQETVVEGDYPQSPADYSSQMRGSQGGTEGYPGN